MRALIWARASDERRTTETQLLPLREAASQRGLTIVKEVVLEGMSAWTGADHEIAVAALLERARDGEFDVLLITAIDRLTRRGAADALNTCRELFDSGVEIVSLREAWLAESTFREPLIAIFGWIAQEESRIRSERMLAVSKRLQAEGKHLGGRRDVTQLVDIGFVQTLRDEGVSWRKIAASHPRTIKTPRGGWKAPAESTIRKAVGAL